MNVFSIASTTMTVRQVWNSVIQLCLESCRLSGSQLPAPYLDLSGTGNVRCCLSWLRLYFSICEL